MNDQALRTNLKALHKESFGWALACCAGNRTVAEEALQSTYLKILEGRARFSGRSSFRTWLFSVIRFTAIDLLRSERLTIAEIPEPQSPASDPPDRTQEFRALLAKLSQRQREILYLVFYHDLTIEKAAVVMGVSIGTARTHYARGKDHLRVLLNQNSDEPEPA